MNLNYLRHAKCSESTGKSLVAKKKIVKMQNACSNTDSSYLCHYVL